jgi:hypothetical protein
LVANDLWAQPVGGRLHSAPSSTAGKAVTEKNSPPARWCSTNTGDACLLDIADQLAARLARDGDPEPIHPEETDTSFANRMEGPLSH